MVSRIRGWVKKYLPGLFCIATLLVILKAFSAEVR
jgi:hypothetical protein